MIYRTSRLGLMTLTFHPSSIHIGNCFSTPAMVMSLRQAIPMLRSRHLSSPCGMFITTRSSSSRSTPAWNYVGRSEQDQGLTRVPIGSTRTRYGLAVQTVDPRNADWTSLDSTNLTRRSPRRRCYSPLVPVWSIANLFKSNFRVSFATSRACRS